MSAILLLVAQIISLYQLLILIRVICSWFFPYPTNPLLEFLFRVTDPLLNAARNAFPVLSQGGMDFSPILIIILLHMTKQFLFNIA